jgi:hypothetical protein
MIRQEILDRSVLLSALKEKFIIGPAKTAFVTRRP